MYPSHSVNMHSTMGQPWPFKAYSVGLNQQFGHVKSPVLCLLCITVGFYYIWSSKQGSVGCDAYVHPHAIFKCGMAWWEWSCPNGNASRYLVMSQRVNLNQACSQRHRTFQTPHDSNAVDGPCTQPSRRLWSPFCTHVFNKISDKANPSLKSGADQVMERRTPFFLLKPVEKQQHTQVLGPCMPNHLWSKGSWHLHNITLSFFMTYNSEFLYDIKLWVFFWHNALGKGAFTYTTFLSSQQQNDMIIMLLQINWPWMEDYYVNNYKPMYACRPILFFELVKY